MQMTRRLLGSCFNPRPGLPYTELGILLPGDFCVKKIFLTNWHLKMWYSYGILSTIVKIAILKIILVTGNLVYSKAVDLQKHSLQSPGSCHSGLHFGTPLKFVALQFKVLDF